MIAEQLTRLMNANNPDTVLLEKLREGYLLGSDPKTDKCY